jgi:hypothetical protein
MVELEQEVQPRAEIDVEQVRSARAMLDAAKDRADRENPDRRYRVDMPMWGSYVLLKRLSIGAITRAYEAAEGDTVRALQVVLRETIVDPPFSAGEVTEILEDADQVEAATLLMQAVGKLNKMDMGAQGAALAAFRKP